MNDWLSLAMGETPLPLFVRSFAKPASGSSSDDEEEEEEDDEEEEEDEEEDDDPDAGKSDAELLAELKETRRALKTANGQSAKRRKALRAKEAELIEARRPKPKKKGEDDDAPDLEALREEARREGAAPAIKRAKLAEAKSALIAAGVSLDRVARAAKQLDLDEMDLDDDGLDGIDEAIDALKVDLPEFFAKGRRKRASISGEVDRAGGGRRVEKLSPSERQARAVTRGGR